MSRHYDEHEYRGQRQNIKLIPRRDELPPTSTPEMTQDHNYSLSAHSEVIEESIEEHEMTIKPEEPPPTTAAEIAKDYNCSLSACSEVVVESVEKHKDPLKMKIKQEITKMAACSYCDKTYASVGSLNRHLENVHRIKAVRGNKECLSCGKKFTMRMKLAQHLKIAHGRDFEVDLLEFKTIEEFESWRAEEEKRSVSMFRKFTIERPCINGSTYILICSRDGQARIKPKEMRQRSLKSQGTRKTGRTCTSHMVVNKVIHPVPKIVVKYVKTHYGHEPEVQHTRICQADKERIAKQLALGVSEARIMSEVSVNEAGPSRLEILSKKDIANIRCQFGIVRPRRRRGKNYSIDKDTCVDEEKTVENPCVKSCKKYGEENLEDRRLKEEFDKYLDKFLEYKDHFSSLPISNQQKIIRHLKNSIFVLMESLGEDTTKEIHQTKKINSKKRKISKQEGTCKKVREIQKSKRKRKNEAKDIEI